MVTVEHTQLLLHLGVQLGILRGINIHQRMRNSCP